MHGMDEEVFHNEGYLLLGSCLIWYVLNFEFVVCNYSKETSTSAFTLVLIVRVQSASASHLEQT